MAQQTINIGSAPNDGTGDTIRDGGDKINDNFTELYGWNPYRPGGTDVPIADGGTGASSASAARTNLGATTVGANVFTLTDPSAIRFMRINADNTVDALDATAFRTAIGAGTGSGAGVDVEEDGVSEGTGILTLNFTTGLDVSVTGTEATISASGGGGGGGAWSLQGGPLDNEAPATNYATLDSRNSHPVIDYDPTTQEGAMWTRFLPPDYAGGGITLKVAFAATSATTGTAGFDVAIERIDASGLDIDADSFGTAHTLTALTVPGTSGQVMYGSINIADGADMDSLAAGELFRLRIRRDVANDTAASDIEVLRWLMVEQ